MRDITTKVSTHRNAIAQATLHLSNDVSMEAVRTNTVPKGNVFEFSRAAGLLAIKRTSDVIPDCHPLPIEHAAIRSTLSGSDITIECEVHSIYKTGVEMEALHGATVAALTMYDMLKPLDNELEIRCIRLLAKRGGKSDYRDSSLPHIQAAVVVCSDSVSAGKKQDRAGKAVCEKLNSLNINEVHYEIIADETEIIQKTVKQLCENNFNLILLTGGTGLSPRDVTPEAVQPLLEREIPGIMEAARNYGQQRTPFAMLSRGIAGMRGNALIITLPGSTRGAEETMDALFPSVLHIFRVAQGARHE